MPQRYYRLKDYLETRFGGRVQRVTLEGGFTCPNRDGTKAVGGCSFCTDDGSSSGTQIASDNIKTQLIKGIEEQGYRFKVDKFIAYFQSFTNTYADIDYLRMLYDQAVDHPAVKVLAIGSRPDCVPEAVIDLLEEYTARGIEVWVDIGVQSSHNRTLDLVNRAHSFEDFMDAASRLAWRQNPLLRICTHVILGLPGETKAMMLETAERLAETPINDIKIHQLCILKGTPLEIDYLNGDIESFSREEYIEILAEFIARLPSNIVIQRLLGEGKKGELLSPLWAEHGQKQTFLKYFHAYLDKHCIYQGLFVEKADFCS